MLSDESGRHMPSVLIPLAADQPSWARRVVALEAGPAPIPFRALTAQRLARAILEAVTNPTLRRRAAALGERLRQEDGTGRAAQLFEEYIARRGHAG
jgi:UDP:flavonoid glycosyltransferase YjiC (YdhE family)